MINEFNLLSSSRPSKLTVSNVTSSDSSTINKTNKTSPLSNPPRPIGSLSNAISSCKNKVPIKSNCSDSTDNDYGQNIIHRGSTLRSNLSQSSEKRSSDMRPLSVDLRQSGSISSLAGLSRRTHSQAASTGYLEINPINGAPKTPKGFSLEMLGTKQLIQIKKKTDDDEDNISVGSGRSVEVISERPTSIRSGPHRKLSLRSVK
jgi:hypothetical protein